MKVMQFPGYDVTVAYGRKPQPWLIAVTER